MTREECEQKIFQKAREIAEIMKEYNPNCDYLDLCLLLDKNHCAFNNTYWSDDEDTPLNYWTCDLLQTERSEET